MGEAASSGCIRLFQQEIIDPYSRVDKGRARVTVLTQAEAGEGTVPPGRPLPTVLAQAPAIDAAAADMPMDGSVSDQPLGSLSSTPQLEERRF